jgi:tripartite-type tricarboxylate transporter receptor subunit TctC
VAILYGYAAVIMLSRADSDLKTIKDIVAAAQKKPGEIIVAVGPTGTSLTLEVELLKRAAKIDITSLPFAGSAQIITNLLGGHINLAMASDVAALPHIKSGKLHGVAVDVNSAPLPEVATFAKQGYPQVNLLAHLAFLAPQGTPDATVKTLADAIRKTLQEPKLQENLKSRGTKFISMFVACSMEPGSLTSWRRSFSIEFSIFMAWSILALDPAL